jgi:hypothetical protein
MGCGAPRASVDLIFVNGRAVASAGDTLLGITSPGINGLVVRDRRTGAVDTIGGDWLTSPQHVQELDGYWYVSDVANGRTSVVQLAADGSLERRIALDTLVTAPHQFAVLPDGRLVVESPRSELLVLTEEGVKPFALVEAGRRTGLLVAARGGVVHAVPGRAITLYNAQGNIRWRLDWPWRDAAFVSDLAVDAHGRIHVIAGEEGRDGFVVFSLSPVTGEVVRWSEFGPSATFVVNRMGVIRPDSARNWLGG